MIKRVLTSFLLLPLLSVLMAAEPAPLCVFTDGVARIATPGVGGRPPRRAGGADIRHDLGRRRRLHSRGGHGHVAALSAKLWHAIQHAP